MKTTGRPLAFAFAAVLVLGSCTGGGTDGQTGPSGATAGTGATGETGPTPAQTFSGPPGTAVYSYANAGLEVRLEVDGNEGTLEVDNGTGRELPPPGLYLLDARDGSRIDGEVTDPAPIPDGRTAAFDVSFTGVEVRNIGLVILLLGQDNYGAFVRTG